jgi:hypothetical protein
MMVSNIAQQFLPNPVNGRRDDLNENFFPLADMLRAVARAAPELFGNENVALKRGAAIPNLASRFTGRGF